MYHQKESEVLQSGSETCYDVWFRDGGINTETGGWVGGERTEFLMLRFSLGLIRMDRIRNEYIRGTTHAEQFGDNVRDARLRWFGHVQR